jgi:hypothetical protein
MLDLRIHVVLYYDNYTLQPEDVREALILLINWSI